MQKSVVYFSKGVERYKKLEVAGILGVKQMESTYKYLGHQLLKSSHLIASHKFLEDKFSSKTAGWKRIFLTHAGRTMLIKTESGPIPPFYMATYLLPMKTLNQLTRIIQNFWWGHDKEVKKMYFINWDQFELEKEKGDLGIRSLQELNKATIAKFVWKFLEDEDCLRGKKMKAKYVKGGNFWEGTLIYGMTLGYHESQTTKPDRRAAGDHRITKVEDLIIQEEHRWDENKLQQLFNPSEAAKIILCDMDIEINEHLFIYCQATQAIIFASLLGLRTGEQPDLFIQYCVMQWLAEGGDYARLRMGACMWRAIWKARNDVVFNRDKLKIKLVLKEAMYLYNMESCAGDLETMPDETDVGGSK
ncbi:uncharacterized protein LOC113358923 [Papaver somniferum]|uniref:uncharacterized protein LOC113358923 n=1 Tax=Papaver somniferum TaxID=3469 RepID=UPI000E700618|nr:uncharacterized protein LOC113358923 [Papaver somniferum]